MHLKGFLPFPPIPHFQDLRKAILSGDPVETSVTTCQPRALSSFHTTSLLSHVQCGSRRFLSSPISGTPYRVVLAIDGDSVKPTRVTVEDPDRYHEAAASELGQPTTNFPAVFLQASNGSLQKAEGGYIEKIL